MANFIPAGANAVETSDIRTSGDVTVTETQPGTVNNGEFLTNSGGSLTGGTVETEPNVPGWEELSNSPFYSTSNPAVLNIPENYDLIKVFLKNDEIAYRTDTVRINGKTSGYHYYKPDGTYINQESAFNLDTIHHWAMFTLGLVAGDSNSTDRVALNALSDGRSGEQPIRGAVTSISSINSIEFIENDYSNAEVSLRAFGLKL